jgi:hypothetical protein
MATKYPGSKIYPWPGTSRIYQNRHFGHANIPSGHPGTLRFLCLKEAAPKLKLRMSPCGREHDDLGFFQLARRLRGPRAAVLLAEAPVLVEAKRSGLFLAE